MIKRTHDKMIDNDFVIISTIHIYYNNTLSIKFLVLIHVSYQNWQLLFQSEFLFICQFICYLSQSIKFKFSPKQY